MNDKELNLAILAELNNFAKRVFEKIAITPGTYTASQIAKQIDLQEHVKSMLEKNPDYKAKEMAFTVSFNNAEYMECNINVGSFKCIVNSTCIFHILSRFEKVAGMRNNVRFTRMDDTEEPVDAFKLWIEKKHFDLIKLVSNDAGRPGITQILVDYKRKCLVATNGHVIREISARFESEADCSESLSILINPKHIKGMLGENNVIVYKDKTKYINLDSGNEFINDLQCRYPNYTCVYPKLSKDGFIKFEKNELKSIAAFAKSITTNYIPIKLNVVRGENFATLSFEDFDFNHSKSVNFKLEHPANITIAIGYYAERFKLMLKDWDGGMWLTNPDGCTIFDYKNANLGLVTPAHITDSVYPDIANYTINPLERHSKKVKAETIKPKKADTVELSERSNCLPAVPVETSANVIPHICAIQAITDVFSGIVKAAIKGKAKSKQTANIWTIIQAIDAACKNPIFGECRIITVKNTVKAEGWKSPIPNKAVLRPCNELSGGMRVIVRNGGGIAPMEKKTYINAGLLIHLDKANGIHRIRDGTIYINADGMECITNKLNDNGNSFDMYYCLLCGRA